MKAMSRRRLLRVGTCTGLGLAAADAVPLAGLRTARAAELRLHAAASPSLVTVGMSQEPNMLNPVLTTTEVSRSVEFALFSSLFNIDQSGTFVPGLVTQVPSLANGGISRDGLRYTFHLRRDVKWQDGTPLTSRDVRFTLETVLDPKVKVPNRSNFSSVKAVSTPDNWTVVLTMNTVFAPFLTDLADLYIIPFHVLHASKDINTDPFNRHPMGSGPYTFVTWVSGDHITLKANPSYFRGRPKIDQLAYKIVPDRNVLLTQLQSGDVDIIGDSLGINYDKVSQVKGASNLVVKELPGYFYEHIDMNMFLPTFADLSVRRALSYATDKETIVKQILYGLVPPATGYLSPVSWAYNPHVPTYPFNLSKAQQTLEAGGWKVGSGGIRAKGSQRLSFTLSSTTGDAVRAEIEQFLQQQWREIGVEMKISNQNAASLFGTFWTQSQYQAIMLGQIEGPDPDARAQFASNQIPKLDGQGLNTVGLRNKQVDRLFTEALTTVDRAKRKALYTQVQTLLANVAVNIPLYYKYKYFGWSKRLQGVALNPNVVTPTWNVFDWSLKG
jgi:peptide/nickel transport system substrate-binding protein